MSSLHIYIMLIYGFISAYGKLDPNTDRERETNNKLLCAQVVGSISHISDDGFDMYGTATSSPVVNCEDDSKYCYALWKEEITNGTVAVVIMGQGCWETSGKPNDCERTDCISDKKSSRAQNNTRFCCCSGDLCNLNVTNNSVALGGNASQVNTQTKSSLPHLTISTGYPVPTVIAPFLQPQVVLLYGVVVLIPITFALLIYICWWRQPKKLDIELGGPVDNGNGGLPAMPSIYNLENVKLTNIIGQGHYGSVWKAVVDTQDVAVKAFPAHHKHYFLNEYDLYQVVGDHVNLATCFGGGERCVALPNSAGITTNYLLLLGLEKECLQEYLKKNTLDLLTLSRMSLGIAKGLAHLHCDLRKLCVAHRDLNTRNILVSADLTCRICDLGLAVVPRRTENRSLSEAGTLRYMAPEVLEGAVNLRDCESALKQIDVYALGLVLWELCGRCTDLQSAEPEPYAPPFHHETGDTPTLEQMQALVSRHKTRPLWPVSWRDEMAAARLLVETTEDCWDQDAEARLTSLCVEERLLELRTLRDRNNHTTLPITPTPLINNNHLTHDQFSINNHHSHFNNRQHQYIDSSVSTIETLLSPSDDNIKNSNQLVAAAILQPHQGKNPCMERNLLNIGSTEPTEQLIDKSAKHCYNRSTTSIPTSTTTFDETQHLLELEYSLNGDNSSNYYKTCRALPIPYLQNAVHSNQDCDSKKNSTVGESSSTMVALRRGLKKIFHVKKEDNGLLKDTQVRIVPTTTKVVNRTSAVSTNILSHQTSTTPVPRPSTLSLKDNNSTKTNSASGITQLLKAHNNPPTNHQLARQRSLEQFHEIFSSSVDLSRLKDVAVRVKTPGDVPASVRRTRGKAARESCSSEARMVRFSLYDDRMMTPWGSAPHLEPPQYCVDSAMNVVGGGSSAVVIVPLKKGDEKRDRDS